MIYYQWSCIHSRNITKISFSYSRQRFKLKINASNGIEYYKHWYCVHCGLYGYTENVYATIATGCMKLG